jgi:hypothetical protein
MANNQERPQTCEYYEKQDTGANGAELMSPAWINGYHRRAAHLKRNPMAIGISAVINIVIIFIMCNYM